MIIALSIVERIGNGRRKEAIVAARVSQREGERDELQMFRVLFNKWRSQALGSAFPEGALRIISLEDNRFKR